MPHNVYHRPHKKSDDLQVHEETEPSVTMIESPRVEEEIDDASYEVDKSLPRKKKPNVLD